MGADRRADSGAMAWPWALLAHAGVAHTLRYTGGLLGVRADVTLYTTHARAAIRLRGIPVGGVLEGGASYDVNYNVSLDQSLTSRLRKLRVQVLAVAPSATWDRVYVTLRLPLFLGTRTIGLARDTSLTHRTSRRGTRPACLIC